MTTINETIAARIQERVEATGKSARSLSMRATGKPDAIRTILKQGVMPSADRLEMLAHTLGTSTAYLLGATDDPAPLNVRYVTPYMNRMIGDREVELEPQIIPSPGRAEIDHVRKVTSRAPEAPSEPELSRAPVVPPRSDMPKDIPVYGTAVGTSQDIEALENGAIAVEQTDLNTGDVIDYFRRPPGLANSRKAYGLYVAGFSMEPAYEPGAVIIVDPSRPPSVQDYVVVYMRGSEQGIDDNLMSAVLLKRLVRRSSTFIELEQYNPPARFRVDASKVAQMHRVLPLAEIVGV
jgi:phage repressor protein C with HTH and peptisase S24 domain